MQTNNTTLLVWNFQSKNADVSLDKSPVRDRHETPLYLHTKISRVSTGQGVVCTDLVTGY